MILQWASSSPSARCGSFICWPIFFVVTKLLRQGAALLVFAAAAVLEMLPVHTGWILIDEFASRYVYFFAGYWLAPHVFKFARQRSAAESA